MQRQHPEVLPLIRLQSQQQTAKQGLRPFWIPVFGVVGWQMPDGRIFEIEHPQGTAAK
jgi:hypothetical protein